MAIAAVSTLSALPDGVAAASEGLERSSHWLVAHPTRFIAHVDTKGPAAAAAVVSESLLLFVVNTLPPPTVLAP